MVSFEFGGGERLLWEMQNPANIFLHANWRDRVEANGFASELRSYQSGMKDGGRHSALSRDWSFGNADCIVVRIDNAEALRRLLGALLNSEDALVLNPAAITRWIERLRHFFPALDRFDRPDPHFDEAERTYKLEIAAELKAAITQPGSDQDLADAVNTALAKSNLLQWRAYWPMSPKGDADREKLWPALRELVDAALGAADGHALALEAFVNAWIAAVPNGKPDPARQIGEFLLLHLAPNEGIYIRHSVRQDLWLKAVGSRFPDHSSMAETYRDEWRFMKAVRSAFEAQGLAPRDMIDVQGALWVVHNYKEEDAASFSREAIEAAMDAYDSYRQSGEHAAVFDAFGEPRDYWVRSTRDRPNRIYPSKPVVGILRGITELNGGWGKSPMPRPSSTMRATSSSMPKARRLLRLSATNTYSQVPTASACARAITISNWLARTAKQKLPYEQATSATTSVCTIGIRRFVARSGASSSRNSRRFRPRRTPCQIPAVPPSSPISLPRRKGTNP
jgi:hypothetical protein